MSFPPGCCHGPRRLFSSSWFSSPSFLYASSSSSSLRSHSRWLCCPSCRRSPFPCPSLCLHRCPEGAIREEYVEKGSTKKTQSTSNKLTIFLRFFVLTGFPSLSFFLVSFFFFGRPFFLHGMSLSETSGLSSAREKHKEEVECERKTAIGIRWTNNLLNEPLIPAEHNYAQQKLLQYGHSRFGNL